MINRNLFIGAAAIALVACGNGGDQSSVEPTNARAASVSAASPIDAPFRLKGAEALDVDRLLAVFPERVRPTYESARFDEKLGATVLENVRFSTFAGEIETRDEDGKRLNVTGAVDVDGFVVERAELYGVDQAAIDRLLATPNTPENPQDDAPMERVFEKVRLFGLKGVDDDGDGDVTIGAVEIDRLSLRPGGPRGDIDGDEGERSAAGVAALFNAFSFGGVYFKDIVGNADSDTPNAPAVGFAAPDVRLVGAGGGKLEAIIANDFEYTVEQSTDALDGVGKALPQAGLLLNGPLRNFIAPEKQRVAIETIEWRGIDFSGLMAYGLKDERPPFSARDLIDLGSIKMTDAVTYIGEKRFAVAPETVVSDLSFTWLAPSKVRSVSRDVSYDFSAYVPDDETAALEIIKKYKLDKVKGDSIFSYDWDADSGEASLRSDFTSPALADFKLGFSVDGVSLAAIEEAEKNGVANPVGELAAIESLEIVLDDNALLDAGFELAKLQNGGAGGDLRKTAPTTLRFLGLQAAALNPRISDYIDAIAGFIENGGKLTIKADPEQPVPLKSIGENGPNAPQTLPDVFNLTIELEE